jgi:hypothetical protein
MAKSPRIFCSTKHADQPAPPLSSARFHIHSRDFDVWSVDSSISTFLSEVRPLLEQRSVISACILSEMPPEGKEWVFFEWFWKLVVSRDLVVQVFRDTDAWTQTQVYEELNVVIFEPPR